MAIYSVVAPRVRFDLLFHRTHRKGRETFPESAPPEEGVFASVNLSLIGIVTETPEWRAFCFSINAGTFGARISLVELRFWFGVCGMSTEFFVFWCHLNLVWYVLRVRV